MTEGRDAPGGRRPAGTAGPDASLVALVAEGVLDAELAALLSVLVEGRVPLLVAGVGGDRDLVLRALLSALPAATRRAASLAEAMAHPAPACLVVRELAAEPGAAAIVRATTRGLQLAATVEGEGLEDVLARLRGAGDLSDDELSHLGVVLVVRAREVADRSDAGRSRAAAGPRIVAAHYLRPLVRDAGGHLQRPGPAVLATWDERDETFSHFAWGVTRELAERVGRRPGDLERELERRAAAIDARKRSARAASEVRNGV